ncbi:MAG TPA: MaoC family dehydratase [Azospirillaceae bacterium]|nr:MaoC family dehydratase [Azospirillaceae bacterium]
MAKKPRFFDDLAVGMVFRSGVIGIDESEVLAFARRYDPQPYHLSHEAGKASLFDGLAASGWQTAALVMRLFVNMAPYGSLPILGRGVEELRWLSPVRPGDSLRAEGEVLALTPSQTRPDRGVVRMMVTAFNQSDRAVYSFIPTTIVPCRGADLSVWPQLGLDAELPLAG